jgi:tetratricopeptide (TPR) repeat protein
MTEPAALRPLIEAAEQIRRLDDYESPGQLGAAIRAVGDAVERALRIRLRNDRAAPDAERLNALSREQLPLDDVVRSLRTRDLISMEAAGTVHEAMAAVGRAETGEVRPRDADVMRAAVDRVRAELAVADAATADGPDRPDGPDGPDGHSAADSAGSSRTRPPGGAGTGSAEPKGTRWMRWLAAAFAASMLVGVTWVAVQGGHREYDAAMAAFRAGRMDSASAGFERVLEEEPGNVTAMLYLARSQRRMGRPAEAAEVLRDAVELAPEDGDVRRELGHLFMDLDRPMSAIAQYERALEYEPEQPLNWAALIRALRQTGDPRAEQLLREAPPEVQATGSGP